MLWHQLDYCVWFYIHLYYKCHYISLWALQSHMWKYIYTSKSVICYQFNPQGPAIQYIENNWASHWVTKQVCETGHVCSRPCRTHLYNKLTHTRTLSHTHTHTCVPPCWYKVRVSCGVRRGSTHPPPQVVGEKQVSGEVVCEGGVKLQNFLQRVSFDDVEVAVRQRSHVSTGLSQRHLLPEHVTKHVTFTCTQTQTCYTCVHSMASRGQRHRLQQRGLIV